MANIYSLPGSRLGTLTVLRRVLPQRGNQARYLCRCECGKELVRLASALLTGRFEPCGCVEPTSQEPPAEAQGPVRVRRPRPATEAVVGDG